MNAQGQGSRNVFISPPTVETFAGAVFSACSEKTGSLPPLILQELARMHSTVISLTDEGASNPVVEEDGL